MKNIARFCILITFIIVAIGGLLGCGGVEVGYSSTESYMEEKTKGIEKKDVGGYVEEDRKIIFLELMDLEAIAEKEAVGEFPIDKSDPNYADDNLDKYKKLKRELSQKYKEELAEKYGFTVDQMDALRREGFKKDWAQADY